MWLLGGLGFCGSLLAFVLSFIPPGQIAVGSKTVWFSVLIIGCIVVVIIPFIIYAMRKPSWQDASTIAEFAPFHWEEPASTTKGISAQNGSSNSMNTNPSKTKQQ